MAAPKNPLGGKSDKIWRDAILRAVHRTKNGGQTKHLEHLANKLVERGLEGDVTALKEIGDRVDGKPTQGIQPLDENGKPTAMNIQVTLVQSNNKC